MKYYIIAGEASGDLHGSNLIKQLHLQDTAADIRCWGGDFMQQAGASLVKHYRELAFMGFAEVLKNLPTILKNIQYCKSDIALFKPDVLVLIDYPGFNLRIAEWAKLQGFKVVYYISPQVWAWKSGRVKKMKQCIDEMLVILPFEADYFREQWQWPVTYVGHPLMEAINQFLSSPTQALPSLPNHKPIIALLPGSRKQEIAKKLPVMLSITKYFQQYNFVIAQAPGQDAQLYAPYLKEYPQVSLVSASTYQLLQQSKAALVTSGTATLETALLGVPEVVCYKTSQVSYAIGKQLVKIKYISLVNLIMNKEVVRELIQDQFNPQALTKALQQITEDANHVAKLQQQYAELRQKLGGNPNEATASIKAAARICAWAANK